MMNKLFRYMQNYLMYGFLPVVAMIGWSFFHENDISAQNVVINNPFVNFIYDLLSYNIMLWFATLILFMIGLIIFPAIREKTLRRMANLQERDEREEYITGRAARASYLATLSLTLFFLFLSMFNFSYSKLEKTSPDKPGHNISIGFGYHFFGDVVTENKNEKGVSRIFDSTNYTLSGSTLLILLLGWQLLIFNLNARKFSE